MHLLLFVSLLTACRPKAEYNWDTSQTGTDTGDTADTAADSSDTEDSSEMGCSDCENVATFLYAGDAMLYVSTGRVDLEKAVTVTEPE